MSCIFQYIKGICVTIHKASLTGIFKLASRFPVLQVQLMPFSYLFIGSAFNQFKNIDILSSLHLPSAFGRGLGVIYKVHEKDHGKTRCLRKEVGTRACLISLIILVGHIIHQHSQTVF